MRKIPTLFLRNTTDRAHVTDQPNPDCMWVFDGIGVATRKFDGTCTRLDAGGDWWARREIKPGKAVPPGYVEEEVDVVTGKIVGWEPIGQSSFAKAFDTVSDKPTVPGTYELCGPKINGNPEGLTEHRLIRHGGQTFMSPTYEPWSIIEEARQNGWEGVVWHEVEGPRRAKLKVKDIP